MFNDIVKFVKKLESNNIEVWKIILEEKNKYVEYYDIDLNRMIIYNISSLNSDNVLKLTYNYETKLDNLIIRHENNKLRELKEVNINDTKTLREIFSMDEIKTLRKINRDFEINIFYDSISGRYTIDTMIKNMLVTFYDFNTFVQMVYLIDDVKLQNYWYSIVSIEKRLYDTVGRRVTKISDKLYYTMNINSLNIYGKGYEFHTNGDNQKIYIDFGIIDSIKKITDITNQLINKWDDYRNEDIIYVTL